MFPSVSFFLCFAIILLNLVLHGSSRLCQSALVMLPPRLWIFPWLLSSQLPFLKFPSLVFPAPSLSFQLTAALHVLPRSSRQSASQCCGLPASVCGSLCHSSGRWLASTTPCCCTMRFSPSASGLHPTKSDFLFRVGLLRSELQCFLRNSELFLFHTLRAMNSALQVKCDSKVFKLLKGK